MNCTEFYVPGEPQGKARPRFTRIGRTYTPKKTVEYENQIKSAFAEAGGKYSEYPVSIRITAMYAMPQSASKSKKQKMILGEILPLKKPDLDNIAKAVCDALNGIAYKDDSQVCRLAVIKQYGTEPGIMVSIKEIIP